MNLQVHITDVKKITLTEQVADDYENLGKGDSAKSVFQEVTYQISIGQQYMKTWINPLSQSSKRIQLRTLQPQLHPQVEGPPSSHLRSKSKQQLAFHKQGQPECNLAQIEVNTVKIAPKCYFLMQWTKTLLWAKRVSKHKAPVAARCTLIVAMAVYRLKCNQTNVKTVQ